MDEFNDDVVTFTNEVQGKLMYNRINEPNQVTLCGKYDEDYITINFETGKIEVSETLTMDQGAMLFWDTVSYLNPIEQRNLQELSIEQELFDSQCELEYYKEYLQSKSLSEDFDNWKYNTQKTLYSNNEDLYLKLFDKEES